MKVTFYYVRHGKTLFNETGRIQGACDSPLTEEGIRGAEDTASALRKVHFDHVFCSSSERAVDTANAICAYHHEKPVCMKGLKEFDFGRLDGEPMRKYASMVWGDHMLNDWTPYGGESLEIFDKRTRKAFSQILDQCKDGDRVLIVSHGSFINHLMKTLLNFDQEAYAARRKAEGKPTMPNCGICIFTCDNGNWSLTEEPMTADEYRVKHDPKTVSFWYVRHGETVFNTQKRMQGQCDSPLTDKGIQQVEETAEKLKDITFDRAYCSPAERTRDTAAILLKDRNMTAIPDPRLKEVFYGKLEGTEYEENWKEIWQRHLKLDYKDLGGEDRKDVSERITTFLRDACDEAEDGDQILLVSHGDYYLSLLETMFHMDRKNIYEDAEKEHRNPMPNAGVFTFHYENGEYTIDHLMQ